MLYSRALGGPQALFPVHSPPRSTVPLRGWTGLSQPQLISAQKCRNPCLDLDLSLRSKQLIFSFNTWLSLMYPSQICLTWADSCPVIPPLLCDAVLMDLFFFFLITFLMSMHHPWLNSLVTICASLDFSPAEMSSDANFLPFWHSNDSLKRLD